MAHLPQGVVRRVGCIIDRTLIDESKTRGSFLWRRFDAHPANDLRGVTGTAFAIFDFDLEGRSAFMLLGGAARQRSVFRSQRIGGFSRWGVNPLQRNSIECRCF